MPAANSEHYPAMDKAIAGLLSLSARDDDKKKRPSAKLPDAEENLSGGTIAGIVIGVIVGLAIIAGLVTWWLLEQKRRKVREAVARENGTVEKNYDTLDAATDSLGSVQSPDTAVSELPPDWLVPELESGKGVVRHEMPGDDVAKVLVVNGKDGDSAVELEGDIPGLEGKEKL